MQKIISIIIVSALITILVGACTKSPEKKEARFIYHPDVSANQYYPLSVGNSWTFDVLEYDFEGEPEKSTLITQVIAAEKGVVTLVSGNQNIKYRIAKDGIFKYPSNRPLIKLPIRTGEEWTVDINGETGVVKIVSVDEKIITNAGMFTNCLLIEESYLKLGLTIKYYFAPNTGLVRIEEYFNEDDKTYLHLRANVRIYKVQNP